MNCKPGDLAVIVGEQGFGEAHFEGKIVRVTTLSHPQSEGHPGHPCWRYEPPLLVNRIFGPCVALSDASLRPLRNPDEDATDEVIERLGKPVATPEGATA